MFTTDLVHVHGEIFVEHGKIRPGDQPPDVHEDKTDHNWDRYSEVWPP